MCTSLTFVCGFDVTYSSILDIIHRATTSGGNFRVPVPRAGNAIDLSFSSLSTTLRHFLMMSQRACEADKEAR